MGKLITEIIMPKLEGLILTIQGMTGTSFLVSGIILLATICIAYKLTHKIVGTIVAVVVMCLLIILLQHAGLFHLIGT